MPLPVASSDGLTIPAGDFNDDGLAVIILQGGRYGGDWTVHAMIDGDSLGEFSTEVDARRKAELQTDPGYPDRAIETAFIWLMGEAKRQGMRVVFFECLNSRYDAESRPYFCAAQALVASAAFTPEAGVTYADEMTLDAVMGYATAPADTGSTSSPG
jgi:hypothetical protein